MKTKYVLAIFFSSLVIGAAFVWFLSRGPSPVELIAPTQFGSQREAGAAAYEKLKEKVEARKLIIIGIPPQTQLFQDVAFGFLEKLAAANPQVLVLKEPKWPALPADLKIETVDFVFNDEDLSVEAETVERVLNSGRTIVIYSVNIFSSHLIANNPISRFEAHLKRNVMALTIGPLTLHYGGEHKNAPACVGSMRDTQGLYELGCAQLANSRKNYKALLPLDKLTALLVEQTETDYLLQVYLPEKN